MADVPYYLMQVAGFAVSTGAEHEDSRAIRAAQATHDGELELVAQFLGRVFANAEMDARVSAAEECDHPGRALVDVISIPTSHGSIWRALCSRSRGGCGARVDLGRTGGSRHPGAASKVLMSPNLGGDHA